jgi:hypothetical protein
MWAGTTASRCQSTPDGDTLATIAFTSGVVRASPGGKGDAVRSAAEPRSQRPLVASTAQELARANGGNVTYVYQLRSRASPCG